VLGSGAVTNYGTVYCYSGRLGSGNFVNNNLLYFDATNTFAISNNLLGSGMAYVRYGGQMTMSGNVSSNGAFRLACGGLLLTNGVRFNVSSDFTIADRLSANYPVDPTNVTATLNVADGTLLSASAMVIGNGKPVTGGGMTGTVNQIGGTVRTFGWNGDPINFPGEREGLRIAHYGLAYGTYNMMGGTLIVDNGYRLSVATSGRGWFRQTGGQVYADDVMVNSRDGGDGYGRLTVEGGVLNVGSNGIAAGVGAPYLVEYGGSGGVIRAVTNFASSLNAVLYGTGTNAGTFDTKQWAIKLSGKMTGQGGLNKTGTGTLTLTGTNAYGGGTSILEGTLSVTNRFSVPNGALRFGVTDSGACGVLSASGDFDLGGLVAGVVNPEALNKYTHYRVVSCTGVLSGTLDKTGLPGSWIVYYDRAMGIAELRSLGSVFWLR